MDSKGLLLFAAFLLVAMSFIHSYLGEKYMFSRLFAVSNLPLFRQDRRFTERVLRFAWHITSIAWLGFAALLFLMSFGNTTWFGLVIAATLAVHGIVIVATCGVRHPAWSLFLLAAIATWLAT
jgi:hypothetical protein